MTVAVITADPELFRLPAPGEDRPRLLGSRAEASGLCFWPRRRRCPVTGGPVSDCDLGPEGKLYAWTFLHVPRMGSISFGDTGGYGVGQIDLPEGVRIQAPLVGTPGDWQIGTAMALTTFAIGEDDGNELVTFRFEAVH